MARRRITNEPDARTGGGFGGGNRWMPAAARPILYRCASEYRGPHNRCQHPRADPRGNRRCAGDPACPVMLPASYAGSLCPWHDEDAAWDDTARARALIGGGP